MSPLELEIEEKSLEDAIAAACEKFKLPREMLEIDVISKGSSGIFGIVGARKAKIRARAKALPLEPAAERAKEILGVILSHIEVPTVIESEARDDHIYLNIVSNGSGLLIGKRGKTLNALQHLVAKVLQKEVGENLTVYVDTEQYRNKRESSLTDLALQLGEKVKRSRRPLTTGPMNAQDRRIIHLALKEDQNIRTKSKGEGGMRRVVIYPVRKGKVPAKPSLENGSAPSEA
ncbi:MAG: RNA-binding cell elongation regulator Jag/EloR [Syntrophobacteraceae bacterium]